MVNFSCFSTSCLIFFTMTEFWDKPAEKSGKVLAAFLEGLPLLCRTQRHKVHIQYIKSATVYICPLGGIGTLPPPPSPASATLPPEPKVGGGGGSGGAHSPAAGEGLGDSQLRRLKKSLALCLYSVIPEIYTAEIAPLFSVANSQ
jgi:hypothetical protein